MSLKHISGWVNVTDAPGPVDPGYGRPAWGGWSPADPGYDIGAGLRPDNSLPSAPVYPGNKPPGRPVLPPSPDNGLPPMGGAPPHPWAPGHWEIVDPGYGKPPLLIFFPVDPGWGVEVPPPVIGGGPATPPEGNWLPTDPNWGMPIRPCPPAGGKPHPPRWGWLPKPPVFPDNTLPPAPEPK